MHQLWSKYHLIPAFTRVCLTYGVFFFPALITLWRRCSLYMLLLISFNCTVLYFFFLHRWRTSVPLSRTVDPVVIYGALWLAFTILCRCLNRESVSHSSIQILFITKREAPLWILPTLPPFLHRIFFPPTRAAESLMPGHILGQWGVAKRAVLANAIRRAGWTALKGTSGWKVSLLLPSLKQWRITAVAFGWRWFSMELDGLYRMQPGQSDSITLLVNMKTGC